MLRIHAQVNMVTGSEDCDWVLLVIVNMVIGSDCNISMPPEGADLNREQGTKS